MTLLRWIIQFACGCHHGRLSNVFTISKRTYQVCLECGQEFPYPWELMHSVRPKVEDPHAVSSDSRYAEASVI